MELIIKQDNFDLNRINFKYGKKCIKLIYDLNYIKIIGLTLKLDDNIITNQTQDFIYINIEKSKNLSIIKNIDNYFKNKFKDYTSFINNNIIKVKKNIKFKEDENYITLNNLKKINDNFKVQIFSI